VGLYVAQFRQKTLGIVLVNKTGDNIVGVTQAGNVAASLTVSGREFCRRESLPRQHAAEQNASARGGVR
jgi:hypothetical protein